MPTVKLTPALLKRMVLEEKKKIESKHAMEKKALKDMDMDMDEADFASGDVVKAQKPPKGHGAGEVAQYKTLKKLEENLSRKLAEVRDTRLRLRSRILASR